MSTAKPFTLMSETIRRRYTASRVHCTKTGRIVFNYRSTFTTHESTEATCSAETSKERAIGQKYRIMIQFYELFNSENNLTF